MTEARPEVDPYVIGEVQDALAKDPRSSELGLNVTIDNGVIFVTGEVATEERRDAIDEVLKDVASGHEIHNQLTVADMSEPSEAENLS